MIVTAADGQQRPHYALGIAVAVLIVAGYVLVASNPTAPAPTPSQSPVHAVVPSFPSGVTGGMQLSAPPPSAQGEPVVGTSPPKRTATPRPTDHTLHSGPPLH